MRPNTVRLRTASEIDLEALSGVTRVDRRNGKAAVLTLADGSSPQDLLRILVEQGVAVQTFEVGTAPLEEIFIAVVKEQDHA